MATTLFDEQLIARSDLDAAEAAFQVAEARYQEPIEEARSRQALLAQRRSELEIARQQLADSLLARPVRRRRPRAARGRSATTWRWAQPVVTLVRVHPLRLRLAVPEREAARRARRPAGAAHASRAIPRRASRPRRAPQPGDREEQPHAAWSRPRCRTRTARLRPAPSPRAEIVTDAAEPAVLVPASAIVELRRHREGASASRTARPSRSAVRVGRRAGDRVEILEGIDGRRGGRRRARQPRRAASRVAVAREASSKDTHAEARRDLHPPAGLRGHAHPGAGRGRGGAATSAWASTASRRSTCPPCPCAPPCPAPRPRRSRPRSRERHRGGGQHRRGHRGAALDLRRRQLVRHRHLRPRARHRRRGPGRARPRRAVVRELPRRTSSRRSIAKFDNDSTPVLTVALSGDRSLRELTELADKVVKVQLERAAGVGEVRDRRRPRARDQHLGRRRPAGRLQLPITAVRDALVRQNADVPGGNVTGRRARADAAHHGPLADARGVQRPRRRDASTAQPIRVARRRPGRGRHQGAALASRA